MRAETIKMMDLSLSGCYRGSIIVENVPALPYEKLDSRSMVERLARELE
jgi:hypothetical protein